MSVRPLNKRFALIVALYNCRKRDTTDNATQNQEAYNTFIESFIPLLASVPCPKCGMVGLLILYGTHPVVRQL